MSRTLAGDSLLESLPDLVVLVKRDGTVLGLGGGRGVEGLRPPDSAIGQHFGASWPESTARLVMQLTKRAIAFRTTTEARFEQNGNAYDARVSAQGPDRAICVIRPVQSSAQEDSVEATGERPRPELDRRGFLRRFKESMSLAALREKPIALAVIHLDGIPDISQVIAARVSEQIMSAAVLRLSARFSDAASRQPSWYLGQLSENLLAIVLESAERDAIEACISQVCASLREPISAGESEFHLTPYAGVAVLGTDASTPKALLDHARSAAAEAKRSGAAKVGFFSDTLRLKSLARLDIARELSEAIANRHIKLRYVGRHDLQTGRLVAWVGYLAWLHPLRGEIRPAEFLRVAETTGVATALSRTVLGCLREDFAALKTKGESDVRISFGALRNHVLNDEFIEDMEQLIADGGVPANRLELRIAEKTFIAREPTHFNSLQRRGVQLVVDEVGRGLGSLDRLARAPIWGLQLDRAWVTALRSDDVALKVCKAGIGVAAALGLSPIAMGVDNAEQRDALLALGCRYGTGDLYQVTAADITKPRRASKSA